MGADFRDGDAGAQQVIDWINRRADEHKTFRFWARFLLEDYPAYAGVRRGVRTGNFKMRNACLRKAAPIFCGYGKDRCQWQLAVHFGTLTRMTDNDYRVMSELFSTSLGGDAYSRLALDERQEVSNRGYKGATKKITRAFVAKLAAIVGARERALGKIEEAFFPPTHEGGSVGRLVRKREPAVSVAVKVVHGCLAFTADGRDNLAPLDGRVLTTQEGDEILDVPNQCDEVWTSVIKRCVFKDKSARGTIKRKMKFVPPARKSRKSTKQEGRTSTLKKSVNSLSMQQVEHHNILVSLLSRGDSVTKEDLVKQCYTSERSRRKPWRSSVQVRFCTFPPVVGVLSTVSVMVCFIS